MNMAQRTSLLLALLLLPHPGSAAPAGGPMDRHHHQRHHQRAPASHGHAAHLLHHTDLRVLPNAAAWARAEPFPLNATRLLPDGGPFAEAQALNQRYLRYLDVDRLLYQFRNHSGLDPTLGGTVRPYGGWESPAYVHGLINGHFTGHLLSALAFDAAASGSAASAAKGDALIAGLAACQDAVAAANASRSGWLSAFGMDHLERLEAHNATEVWAPYYTLHKIMAGLLDQHEQRGGNAAALAVLTRLAAYLHGRIAALKAAKGEAWWAACLDVEFGGMNELGYNLFAITGDAAHRELGDWFYKGAFMDPLDSGVDTLNGMHANQHLPEVVGVARGWEVTGNATLANITANFAAILGGRYTFATGGSNVNEHWSSPDALGDAVAVSFDNATDPPAPHNSNGFHTEETCSQYNSLKMLRHLFRWAPSAAIGDDYETKLNNGILGTQQPGVVGSLSYMTPLGRGVNRNQWDWWGFGSANNSFWCCYGSSIEQFAKLSDSIYFRAAAARGATGKRALFVSQFIPSTVRWAEAGALLLRQETALDVRPASGGGGGGGAVTTLTVNITFAELTTGAAASAIDLKVRAPAWSEAGSTLQVIRGGWAVKAVDVVAGTFLDVPPPAADGWAAGDRVVLRVEMLPRLKPINDKRPEYKHVAAIMVGPYVLGGLTEMDNALVADPAKVAQWVVPSEGAGSSSSSGGSQLHLTAVGANRNFTLVALNRLVLENYTVYFNVTQ